MVDFSSHTSPKGQIQFFFDICFCTQIWKRINFVGIFHFLHFLCGYNPEGEKKKKQKNRIELGTSLIHEGAV